MSKKPAVLSREDQAKLEIGHTEITRAQVLVLTVAFLVLIFAVPVVQQIREFRTGASDTGLLRFVRLPFLAARETRPAPAGAGTMTPAREPRSWLNRVFHYNRILLRDMQAFDDDIVADSLLTQSMVPPVQAFLTGALGAGNEKAYVGRDHWLFYRPDIDYVIGPGFLAPKRLIARARSGNEWQTAPQPDPLIAIFQFRKQLAARGIALLIVVAPPKSVVHPERFSSRYDTAAEPVQNLSYEQYLRELRNPEEFFSRWDAMLAPYQGVPEAKARRAWHWQFREALQELQAAKDLIVKNPVLVFDSAIDLTVAKRQTGRPQYLETDTHWTPEAMQRVAVRLREIVDRNVSLPAVTMKYKREPASAANLGDIAVMMKLPAGQKLYRRQEVTVQQVFCSDMQWRPDREADVLLLGDSFSNVFSAGNLGWGEAAGLAEQLSVELGRPVDVIARNDAGAYATREMLSQELAQGRDRLAGKKLVIWEFAGRELASGNWKVKTTPMVLGQARESRFLQVAAGQDQLVNGTVLDASPAPRPGSVTYRDHVIQVHLTNLERADGQALDATDAVVAIYSMRDQVWTAAARYRPGQKVALRLRNYDEVDRALKIKTVKSSLLAGDLELETPCWGEDTADAAGPAAATVTAGVPRGRGSEVAGLLLVVVGVLAVIAWIERNERREAGRSI
jgi:alginate O-acetyltransferase complex protein AlgJ